MQTDGDEHESIKDEDARKDLQTLTARLYDLKERFVKIVHRINEDAKAYADQISNEDDSTDDESTDEVSVDEENENASHSDNDEKRTQEIVIKCLIESKARRYEYLKHVIKYPKIMNYLVHDDSSCLQIPLRYLEPFIQQHVEKNPSGKTYDKIHAQIQDLRRNYLKNSQ